MEILENKKRLTSLAEVNSLFTKRPWKHKQLLDFLLDTKLTLLF